MHVPSISKQAAAPPRDASPRDEIAAASLLFPARFGGRPAPVEKEDSAFADLHLDRIVKALAEEGAIAEADDIFRTPLRDAAAIQFRQDIFSDLERSDLRAVVENFVAGMAETRRRMELASTLAQRNQRNRWLLDAVTHYCATIRDIAAALAAARPESDGLKGFQTALATLAEDDGFVALSAEADQLGAALGGIRYTLDIEGDRVTVRRFADEPEFGAEVLKTFARLRDAPIPRTKSPSQRRPTLNHVEGAILDRLAALFPDVFAALDDFRERNVDFADRDVLGFERDLRFYLGWLTLIAPLKGAGLAFALPTVGSSKEVRGRGVFDLALALMLLTEGETVVANDFTLSGDERILVVSGPNQSGKTSFARAFGQLHHLARLGLPAPGSETRLLLCDRVFTLFEKAEEVDSRHGRLEDDLLRMKAIMDVATADSVLVINDVFGSTTLRDALELGREILRLMAERDIVSAFVTFADELSTANDRTVSVVASGAEEDADAPRYVVTRRPAEGIAHAMAVAERYRLTHAALSERIEGRIRP